MEKAKKILVLGSAPDAALIAAVLQECGVCDAYAVMTPEREKMFDPNLLVPKADPSPVIMYQRKQSDHPKPDSRALPDKSVRMRAKSR